MTETVTKSRQANGSSVQISTLPIAECLEIPRYNYREITKSDDSDLKAFSERLISEGQLTPIRIAELSETALKTITFSQLCGEGNRILIDGERRLLAMHLAYIKNPEFFPTVKAEFIPVDSLKQYLALQMTFNMDRKNTSFTEDGFGFKRYLDNGGKKTDLLLSVNFPEGVLSKKDRLKYLTERIELLDLDESLYPFLNNGLIRAHKSKPHQGYLILRFSEIHQRSLAKEFSEVPHPKTDKEILGFFNRFRTEFKSDYLPFDPDDAGLGISEFGTKACTGCPHLKDVSEEEWGETVTKSYCYLTDCYKAKRQNQAQRLLDKLIEDPVPFVILGRKDQSWGRESAEETLENGLIKIRFYKIVKEGTCSHAVRGIGDGGESQGEVEQGRILFACPEKSGCPIHHPHKGEAKTEKREKKLVSEKSKTEKTARMSTAVDWAQRVLEGDFSAVREELLSEYLIHSFLYFYRGSGSDVQKTFNQILGVTKEKPFNAWSIKNLQVAFEHYRSEKSWTALLFAHLFHDFDQHWNSVEKWGKSVGIDFKKMLDKNLNLSLEELKTIQQKRKAGWSKEKAKLEKQMHALRFDFPIYLNISNWDNEKELPELLSDEKLGKRACRLIGVKSEKEFEYKTEPILQKLKGRKAELELLFPDYELPESEALLLQKFKDIPNKPLEKLIPDPIQFGTGLLFEFLRKGIKKASNENNRLVLAEFLSVGIRDDEKISFTVLHKDTLAVINKVTREESLSGYYDLDKVSKSLTFKNAEFSTEDLKDTEDITVILKSCVVEGKQIKLPPVKLERPLYEQVKKVMDGIGGKWQGGKTAAFVFEHDPTELLEKVISGEKINLKKDFQFFETPPDLAKQLVELADLKESHTILEPSAGRGAIIKAVHEALPETSVFAYELMPQNREVLEKTDSVIVLGNDFLKSEKEVLYDRIIANPPFSKNRDIDHFREMFSVLKKGGKVVSVMSRHWQISKNKKEAAFKNWLEESGAKIIPIEAGTFKESGTMISACIVILNKS